MRSHLLGLGSFLSLAAVVGCGSATSGSDDTGPRTGTVAQPIINGTSQINPWAAVQIVMVFGPTGDCTGELLQNDLVITARHCTTIDGTPSGFVDTDPTHYTITDPATGLGPKVVTPSVVSAMDPSTDVAIFVLNKFLEPDLRQRMQIYAGTDASLQGATVTCLGYGDNTFIPGPFPGTGTGSGWGTLRGAWFAVGSANPFTLTLTPNGSGQIAWHGDSGSTCFTTDYTNGLVMTGVASVGEDDGTQVTSMTYTGPEAFRSWVQSAQQILAVADYENTQQGTQNFNSMILYPAVTDSNARVTVTPNQGNGSTWLNHNIGVWRSVTNGWEVFLQDHQTQMPIGQGFNVSVGGWIWQTTATSSNTFANSTVISAATDPSELLIVTPVYTPSGSFNGYDDQPIGVWWNGSNWLVFNEHTNAPMPVGATFNIRLAFPWDGGYLHCTNSSNVNGRSTILDNPNLNGVSDATVFVTHNWDPPGGPSGVYLPHPTGVWYDGTHWEIANQDGVAMPTGVCFNVMVRP